MANQYDKIFKENIEPLFAVLAQRLLGLPPERFAELKDKLQKTVERETDFIRRVLHDNPADDFIFQLEVQGQNLLRMPRRMLLYRAILYDKYGLPVLQIVLYVGQKPLTMPARIEQENLSFGYHLLDIRSFSYLDFINSDNSEAVLIAILANFGDQTAEQIVERILMRLVELNPDSGLLEKYTFQLHTLSGLRKLQPLVNKKLLAMPLKIDFKKDLFYKQGSQEGKIEGKIEGEIEGEIKAKRQVVINLLEMKYATQQIVDIVNVSEDFVREVASSLKQGNNKK